MKRIIFTTLLLTAFIFFIGCASSGQLISMAPDYRALRGIGSIYLGDFGDGEGADIVREKLRIRLLNSARFTLVESPDRADAFLTRSAGVEKWLYEGTTHHRGTGLLRLVDTKTQKTIWVHEYKRGFMLGGSVSTRVANQMADQLPEDAGAGK
ncbi:MAG: hypothetical protein ACLQBQ_08435 [Smithella sp.]